MSEDRPLTVVSVMTTESTGGAEFAAVSCSTRWSRGATGRSC